MKDTMKEQSSVLSRRRIFAGASTVGALAAVAVALPRLPQTESKTEASEAAAVEGDGYRLTPHVLRYYQTARI